MKLNKITRCLLITLLIPVIIGTASAQGTSTSTAKTPGEGDFGIGAMVGGVNNRYGVGAAFSYALQHNIFLTGLISLYLEVVTGDNADTRSYFSFTPGVRYYFENIRNLYPFIQLNFLVNSYLESYLDIRSVEKFRTKYSTGTGIFIGGSWFPYSSIELSAAVNVVEVKFDKPLTFTIGPAQVIMALIFYL